MAESMEGNMRPEPTVECQNCACEEFTVCTVPCKGVDCEYSFCEDCAHTAMNQDELCVECGGLDDI